MMGDHAVSRGVDVGQPGPHHRVHGDRALAAERGPGVGGQGGLGPHPDHDQDHIGGPGHGRAVGCGGNHLQLSWSTRRGGADGLDGGAGQDLYAAGGELGVHEGAESGVDGGQHLG